MTSRENDLYTLSKNNAFDAVKDKVIANLHTSLYKGVEAIAQEVKTRDEDNLMSTVKTRPFLFTNPKIQPAVTTRCRPLKTKGKNTTR